MTFLPGGSLFLLACLLGACGGKATSLGEDSRAPDGVGELLDSASEDANGASGSGMIGSRYDEPRRAEGGSAGVGGSSSGEFGTGGSDSSTGGTPNVLPNQVGSVAESCGGNMWSLDGTKFLNCLVGGEDEFHPECVIVDCTSGGDTEAYCVYSNHCGCSAGFQCEGSPAVSGRECESRVRCVPEE